MKYQAILLAFIFTSCGPFEVAVIEAVAEEAIIIERDILESHEKISVTQQSNSEGVK